MPTYEWKCSSCEELLEEFLPISQCKKHTNKKCKKCGKGKMVINHSSSGGFVLSGQGWPGKGDHSAP